MVRIALHIGHFIIHRRVVDSVFDVAGFYDRMCRNQNRHVKVYTDYVFDVESL